MAWIIIILMFAACAGLCIVGFLVMLMVDFDVTDMIGGIGGMLIIAGGWLGYAGLTRADHLMNYHEIPKVERSP